MIETEKKEERVLLIGVELQGMDNFDLSMEELARRNHDCHRQQPSDTSSKCQFRGSLGC